MTYPARFQLVAAMNPCRCGNALDPGYACKRAPNDKCMAQYQTRISGPLLDRVDLSIEVPAVTAADLVLPAPSEGSAEVAKRVGRARAMQAKRFAELGADTISVNAACPPVLVEQIAAPDASGAALLKSAAEGMRLTARGYHRVLKVARTLADLDGEPKVRRAHLAEALAYRANV